MSNALPLMPAHGALELHAAIRYVSGPGKVISRITFWRACAKLKVEPNVFGTFAIQDLNRLCNTRRAAK